MPLPSNTPKKAAPTAMPAKKTPAMDRESLQRFHESLQRFHENSGDSREEGRCRGAQYNSDIESIQCGICLQSVQRRSTKMKAGVLQCTRCANKVVCDTCGKAVQQGNAINLSGGVLQCKNCVRTSLKLPCCNTAATSRGSVLPTCECIECLQTVHKKCATKVVRSGAEAFVCVRCSIKKAACVMCYGKSDDQRNDIQVPLRQCPICHIFCHMWCYEGAKDSKQRVNDVHRMKVWKCPHCVSRIATCEVCGDPTCRLSTEPHIKPVQCSDCKNFVHNRCGRIDPAKPNDWVCNHCSTSLSFCRLCEAILDAPGAACRHCQYQHPNADPLTCETCTTAIQPPPRSSLSNVAVPCSICKLKWSHHRCAKHAAAAAGNTRLWVCYDCHIRNPTCRECKTRVDASDMTKGNLCIQCKSIFCCVNCRGGIGSIITDDEWWCPACYGTQHPKCSSCKDELITVPLEVKAKRCCHCHQWCHRSDNCCSEGRGSEADNTWRCPTCITDEVSQLTQRNLLFAKEISPCSLCDQPLSPPYNDVRCCSVSTCPMWCHFSCINHHVNVQPIDADLDPWKHWMCPHCMDRMTDSTYVSDFSDDDEHREEETEEEEEEDEQQQHGPQYQNVDDDEAPVVPSPFRAMPSVMNTMHPSNAMRYLGALSTCDRCNGGLLFPFEATMAANRLCCGSKGQIVFEPYAVKMDEWFTSLAEQYGNIFTHEGRTLNMCCSLAAIGVHHVDGRTGAFSNHGGVAEDVQSHALKMDGQVYHYPLLHSGNRLSTFIGSGQSFLFVDPPAAEMAEHIARHFKHQGSGRVEPGAIRNAKEFADCLLFLRKYLRDYNRHVDVLRNIFEPEDPLATVLTAGQDTPDRTQPTTFRVRTVNLSDAATATQPLAVLFCLHGRTGSRPDTHATATLDIGTGFRIDFNSALYEQTTYTLLDPMAKAGFDKTTSKFPRRRELCARLMQSEFARHLPAVRDQLALDVMSTFAQVNAENIQHFKKRNSPGGIVSRATVRHTLETNPKASRFGAHSDFIPSEVRGSNAEKHKLTEMGMSLVRAMGEPSLFVTMTANVEWTEIQDNLPKYYDDGTGVWHKQPWYVNMLLVVRVFEAKLQQLVQGLKDGAFFGGRKAISVQYRIEFQKRGLPHAHIIVTFSKMDSLNTAQKVDSVVTARLPTCHCGKDNDHLKCSCDCGNDDCRLRQIVESCMIHRCGKRCFIDNKKGVRGTPCSQRFPFTPTDRSHLGPKDRWLYKRAADFSDEYVVCYNPQLLLQFNCHINVDACNGAQCVFYIRKYISKNHDTVHVELTEEANGMGNIKRFFHARHYCIAEAYYDLLGFKFDHFYPKIVSVRIHLAGMDMGKGITSNERAKQFLQQPPTTDLSYYFRRPETEEFNTLTFEQFYENYSVSIASPDTTVAENKLILIPFAHYHANCPMLYPQQEDADTKYVVRKRRDRVHLNYSSVSPKKVTLYCLKLLLTHIHCRTYEDLLRIPADFDRTLPGYEVAANAVRFKTFEDAVEAHGWFWTKGNRYHICVLKEMAFTTPAPELANYMYQVLTIDSPEAFIVVFDHMYKFMISRRDRDTIKAQFQQYEARRTALRTAAFCSVSEACIRNNVVLYEYLRDKLHDSISNDAFIAEAKDATQLNHEVLTAKYFMIADTSAPLQDPTAEQQDIFDKIVKQMSDTESPLIYLNGAAGSGKTFLLRMLHQHFTLEVHKNVCACAFAGIAAQLLFNGQTCHSLFKLPVEESEGVSTQSNTPVSTLTKEMFMGRVLQKADIIIIDEVSMLSLALFRAIDETLQRICESHHPFAGKAIILCGDFRQLPEIVKTEYEASDEIVDHEVMVNSILSHEIFTGNQVTRFQLTEGIRFSQQSWADFLFSIATLSLGTPAKRPKDSHYYLPCTSLPPEVYPSQLFPTAAEAMEHQSTILTEPKSTALQLLAPLHSVVQAYNEQCFQKYYHADASRKPYEAYYDLETVCKLNLNEEHYRAIDHDRDPPHLLTLAVGCPVMMLRNTSLKDGMANGALFTIIHLNQHTIVVRPYKSDNPDARITISRIRVTIHHKAVSFARHQFPIRLAFAATINKSQGKTIDTPCIIDLSEDCFMHGQLYVAFSRLRHPSQLLLVVPQRLNPVNTEDSPPCIVSYGSLQLLNLAKLTPPL